MGLEGEMKRLFTILLLGLFFFTCMHGANSSNNENDDRKSIESSNNRNLFSSLRGLFRKKTITYPLVSRDILPVIHAEKPKLITREQAWICKEKSELENNSKNDFVDKEAIDKVNRCVTFRKLFSKAKGPLALAQ